MVRCFIAYVLIVTVIAANFSRLFVYAGFELNRNYIAAHLCQNLDKPWLHCNGKCYFIKKVKQADEKEKTSERQSQKNLFQEAIFIQKLNSVFYPSALYVMTVPNEHIVLPLVRLPIFQPPQFS
jgi:hypothetical protein